MFENQIILYYLLRSDFYVFLQLDQIQISM